MGYLFLAVALLCGVTKGYCGKKTGGALTRTSDAMLVNILRMVLCICIGFGLILVQGKAYQLAVSSSFLAVTALSGIATAVFVVSWLLSVRQGAYMMVDVFLLMGVTVPLLLCRILFHEPILPLQWIGIVILLAAGYIMCTYNVSIKGKMSKKALLLLVICAVSSGLADFSQKLFVKSAFPQDNAVFNFYTYLFAALTLTLCWIVLRSRKEQDTAARSIIGLVRPIFGYVLVMSLCLFLNSYFKTAAAQHLTAAQIYPLNQGGSVVLSLLMSAILFRERINAKCVAGVLLSMGALVLINML